MKTPNNKNQVPPDRIIKVEIPQVNVIKKNRTFTDKAIGRLQSQMESLHTFSKKLLMKINNGLGIHYFFGQKGKANNSNLKLQARSILVIAIVTNLFSLYFHFSGDFLATTGTAKLAVSLWVISVILAGISAWLYAVPFKKPKKVITKKQSISNYLRQSIRTFFVSQTFRFLFPILLLALILRIIPIMNNGLYLDEWYWLDAAKSILKGSAISPFGFVGDYSSNLPAFPVAILLAFVRNPMLAVRLTGVIFSLVTIFFVFELLKDMLGFKTAVVGSILLAVSVWDIHMTNLGYTNTNINPMLSSGTLLLLYKVYSNKYSIRTVFLLALVLAICLHLLYVAAPLIIPALLVLAIRWFKNRSAVKLREGALFCAYFLISLSPIFPKLMQYPEQSIGRHGDFFQQNITMAEESKSSLKYYMDQVNLLFQDYTKGDTNFSVMGLWGITIDPAIQLLSILGILLVIIQAIRKKIDLFWLIILFTFCFLLFVPFILLYRTASVWRAYIILPLIYLFATFLISQFAKFLKSITKKTYNLKGLRKFFLVTITLVYFIVSIPWFIKFSDIYLKKTPIYENIICQYATNLINDNIPRGSTIMMPDELCFPLITILYDDDQYHFISITPDNPKPVVSSGSYLIVFNSQVYTGYFREDIQKIVEQTITEPNVQLISQQSTSRPVLYLIK